MIVQISPLKRQINFSNIILSAFFSCRLNRKVPKRSNKMPFVRFRIILSLTSLSRYKRLFIVFKLSGTYINKTLGGDEHRIVPISISVGHSFYHIRLSQHAPLCPILIQRGTRWSVANRRCLKLPSITDLLGFRQVLTALRLEEAYRDLFEGGLVFVTRVGGGGSCTHRGLPRIDPGNFDAGRNSCV